MLFGQQLHQLVLGVVGVLPLVDEHVLELPLVALPRVVEQLEDLHALDQQVVEVHGRGRVELGLVALVDLRDLGGPPVLGA